MKKKYLLIITLSQLALINCFTINAQVPKDTDLFDDSKEISEWIKEIKVPILALGKIEDYKLSNINVYGNLTDGSKAPYNTIFNVASLTKPIVSMLALKLVDNGNWDLDEPLYKYWIDPDVQDDDYSKKLTTRHILSHQSGFPNWRWQEDSGILKFNFEPGTSYNYSGEGFEYLRKALENKFGKSLDKLADSLLFQPLNMNNTKFFWNDSIDESRFAKWYDTEGNQTYKTHKNKVPNAADDLLTTIEDYGKFAEYVINGAGISESLFNQMIMQQNNKDDKYKMGLGWELFPNLKGDEYALMHTGGDKGVNTMVLLLPKTGEGIIIFTNSDNGKNVFFKTIEGNLSLGK